MQKFPSALFYLGLAVIMSCHTGPKEAARTDTVQLLSLERKWLEAEFALDTATLSLIIDSTFIDIAAAGIHHKAESLLDMYNNISQRRTDSIFIDSFQLENSIVNLYDNTAVVVFIVHTYGKTKRAITERRTRFYDVWIKRNNKWQAVASQGSKVEE